MRRSRREFCGGAVAAALLGGKLWAQAGTGGGSALRPDVAAVDRERILAAAAKYVGEPPVPITTLRSERSPGGPQEYFSEGESEADGGAGAVFTAHRDAVFGLGLRVGTLAAAQLVSGEKRFGDAAAAHLRVWFVDPATRMAPRMEYAAVVKSGSGARVGSATGVIETLPLVEVAQAIPFLAAAGSLSDAELARVKAWFAEYLKWLTVEQDSGLRLAQLARDHKDRHATSWTLQVAAYTLLTAAEAGAPKNEDRAMTELRRRFRAVLLRTQVSAEGLFRQELSTENPFRNSLFNLDMMACLCQLLTTRFESVWEYQLEDGPSMRGAMAYHFRFMAEPAKWPYRADRSDFHDLPGRRVSLLLSARPYLRPEYAALWKSLPADVGPAELQETFPVHQPVLWVRQPPVARG